MNPRKVLRYLYYRCVRIHGKPREVAMGLALGLVVGLTPTMGFQMPVAVVLAAAMGQSKLAAALGVWVTNPLTAPVVYGATYVLGALVLGQPIRPPDGFLRTIASLDGLTSEIFLPLWVGGALLAAPVAPLGYWLTYQTVVAYRLKAHHRRARKLHRWRWNAHDGWHRVPVRPPEAAEEGGRG